MSKLKKILSFLLVFVMVLSVFAGCTGDESTDPTAEPTQEVTEDSDSTDSTDEVILKDPVAGEELGSGDVKWSEEETDYGYMFVTNEDGATLTYSVDSGVKIIQVDGYAFKDLNKNDLLDQYEDWREPTEARVQNLASLLTIEDIAGLMLYSSHQRDVSDELTEDQIAFLDTGGRSVLNANSSVTTGTTAKWNNALQAYAESTSFGIPVNTSSDPRSSGISLWPSNLAIAATFDSEVAAESGEIISQEYRLLGIGTYLGPQIDLATEPRWSRNSGTFGEDPALASDMANAYVSGIQSTYDEDGNDLGWGEDSMNAMIKHWPSDGAGEGGRESHSQPGNSNVYPGGAFFTHLIPFVDGGLSLDSETGAASAIMSSYSIAYSDDEEYGELVGSAYSEYKIKDLLRGDYDYDGVVCTDWGILDSKTWGVEEDLTTAGRVLLAIMAGVDQFGGWNSSTEIVEAYELGVLDYGEEAMDERFRESAARLVRNVFTIGLFENSYINVDEAVEVVNNEEFIAAGYEAQQKSIVMLKNANETIKETTTDEKLTIYVPMMYSEASTGFSTTPAAWSLPFDLEVLSEYFNVVTDTVATTLTGEADEDGNPTVSIDDIVRATESELAECDFAFVIIDDPANGGNMMTGYGYDSDTDTYFPISLQYGEYTADSEYVRKESISGEMVTEEVSDTYGVQEVEMKENRSYYGESARVTNSSHLDTVLYTVESMPEDVPVIVAIDADGPLVVSEFESVVDAIVVTFGTSDEAVLDVVSGRYEPSGLLPMQFPASMEAVEAQYEDVPRDMECYVDSEGNTYDFAYGLNWSGVISDERTATYGVPALTEPTN